MGFPKDPAIFGNISPSKEVGSVALHNEGEVAEGLLCELGAWCCLIQWWLHRKLDQCVFVTVDRGKMEEGWGYCLPHMYNMLVAVALTAL